MRETIQIVEVGPRDGLQNEKAVLAPEVRAAFVRRLEACGVQRIEAASFVNPKRVPQMAGGEEVMANLPRAAAGRSRIGLALNRKGWDRAVLSGCDEVNVVVCATDGFGIRNQGASVQEQIATLEEIAAARRESGGPPLSLTISVAFGCPFEGEVPEARVAEIAAAGAAVGIPEIALADTIGVADPASVRRRLRLAREAAPAATLRVHFHDTRGTALANAWAAVEEGVRVLDASCGGLGGCPFAPGATGNVATEDLVWMLHRAGFETGLDVGGLIEAGRWIGEAIGKPPISALSKAPPFPPA